MADSLDQKVMGIPSFDEFLSLFSGRYNGERTFRSMVHKYMKISGLHAFSLGVKKRIFPAWYRRETESIVRSYAARIYDDLKVAAELEREQKELERIAAEERVHADSVEHAMADANKASNEVMHAENQSAAAISDIQQSYKREVSGIQAAARQQADEIMLKTDAAEVARERLSEYVRASPLIKTGASGELAFDERQIERKLEEIILEEVLSDMAREGDAGFMSKIKDSYDGLIAYFAEIDDLSEIPRVEWRQSIIYSRAHGYRYPQFPYLISGKPEESSGRASIDTALSLDISGSMLDNSRFVVAQKAALALSALMRRLNEKNNTYLSVFNVSLEQVTSLQLLREVNPAGGTLTELAIDWLIETLENSRPSIAYLMTDGLPNHIEATVQAARKFRDHPYIMLRIFLIDGDDESEPIIRQIGRAAGPQTKVIPVKNYQLPNGLIKDLSQAIKGMYSVNTF